MRNITILYPHWLSFDILKSWVSEGFRNNGFDVITKPYSIASVKSSDEPLLYIAGAGELSQFLRLCGTYKKRGIIWIDVFYHSNFNALTMSQKGFRRYGGKFICTTDYDKHSMKSHGVIVDAVIQRCIPDRIFDYAWQGKKKSVMSIGAGDWRREDKIFKWANFPDGLKNITRKGHEYLVEFAKNNPDWSVNLITRRKQLSKICGLRKMSLNLPNLSLSETGSLKEHDLYTMMANSGVYAHPCRYEPVGLGILEAEAIGVPTCFTALPQQVEIGGGIMIPYVENYKFPSGISLAVIDYSEVEKGIYKCHELGDIVSVMCRDNAQRFKTSIIVDKLIEVIENG